MIRDVWFESIKLICNPRTDFIAELVCVGDINGDGIDEVVVADMNGIIAVWNDPKLLITDCRNYNINSGVMTFDNLKWVSMVLINSMSTASEGEFPSDNDDQSYHNRHHIDAEDNIFNFIDNDDIYDGRNNTSDKESSSSSSSSIKKDVCVLKLDGYVQIWTWNTEHFINIFDCMVLDGQLVDLLCFSTHDSVSGSSNNNLIIVERSAVHFYTFQKENKECNNGDTKIVETYKQLLEVHSMDILGDTFMLMSHGSSISVYQFDSEFKNLILVPAEASLPLPSTPYVGSVTVRAGRKNTFAAASLDGRFCVCLLKFGDHSSNNNSSISINTNAKSWSILHNLQTADSLFTISYLHTPFGDEYGSDKFIACAWTGHTYILDINSGEDEDKGRTVYCFEGGLLLQRSAVAAFTCGWLGKKNKLKNRDKCNKSTVNDDSTIIFCSTRGDMYAIKYIFTKIAEVAPPKFPYRQFTINTEIKEKKIDKSKWLALVKNAQAFEHLDESTLSSSNVCSELWRLPQTQLVEILKELH